MFVITVKMDLIHLGAKYAPCMRKDPNIDELHEKIRLKEKESVCCIYTDNSGRYQTSIEDCDLHVSALCRIYSTHCSSSYYCICNKACVHWSWLFCRVKIILLS